jgi:hypothetical protein
MTNYYSNSRDYHDDLDRFEALVRSEQEPEINSIQSNQPQCVCYEFAGDNDNCPVHFSWTIDLDGSNTSMESQLNDAGFGSGGVV